MADYLGEAFEPASFLDEATVAPFNGEKLEAYEARHLEVRIGGDVVALTDTALAEKVVPIGIFYDVSSYLVLEVVTSL